MPEYKIIKVSGLQNEGLTAQIIPLPVKASLCYIIKKTVSREEKWLGLVCGYVRHQIGSDSMWNGLD